MQFHVFFVAVMTGQSDLLCVLRSLTLPVTTLSLGLSSTFNECSVSKLKWPCFYFIESAQYFFKFNKFHHCPGT